MSSRFRGIRRYAREQTKRPIPLADRFAALFQAGDSWFDASNVTSSGGNVTALVDRLDPTHTLAQATGVNQAADPTADAALNNALSLTLSGTQFYTSNRAPSAWKYLHDGLGSTWIHVGYLTSSGAADRTLHSTCDIASGSTTVGSYAELGGVGADPIRVGGFVTNGTGTPASGRIVADFAAGVTNAGVGSYSVLRYSEAAATKHELRSKTTVIASGASAGAPSASDPSFTLRLFASNVTTLPFVGRWRAGYFFRRYLTNAELSTVAAWIAADTGVV